MALLFTLGYGWLAEIAVKALDQAVVNFLDVPLSGSFDVSPTLALEYFRRKGLVPTFSYLDLFRDAHDHSFTVAKMMQLDLLADVNAALDEALAAGISFGEFKKTLMPLLQARGWWGRKDVIDPLTGKLVSAQLGSAWRLETIFRTNMQASYQAQHWQTIESQARVAPFLLYDAVDDFRTRPLHKLWDNTCLRWDDPWWQTHYPPNGYNCRCTVIQLTRAELDAMGIPVSKRPDNGSKRVVNPRTGKTETVPNGIDRGFDRNVGINFARETKRVLAEKIAALPTAMRAGANRAVSQTAAASRRTHSSAAQLVAAANRLSNQAQGDAALARIARSKAGTFTRQAFDELAATGRLTGAAGLKAVTDRAAELRLRSNLIERYRTYRLAGKTPTDAQIIAVNELTTAERAALEAAIRLEAERQLATAQLAGILAGTVIDQGGFLLAALKELSDSDGFDALDPVERLRRVRVLAEQLSRQRR